MDFHEIIAKGTIKIENVATKPADSASNASRLIYCIDTGYFWFGGPSVWSQVIDSSALSIHAASTTTHGVSGNIVGTANIQTLSNKTLTSPAVSDFTNANHTHGTLSQGGQISPWVQTIGTFTPTPSSTSILLTTSDLTSILSVNYPLKYVIDGITYYGIISAITSGAITIAGAPLNGTITALYYSDPVRVTQFVLMVPSTYETTGSSTLILNNLYSNIIWQRAKSYLVKYTVWSKTCDTGVTKGKVSVLINGSDINTSVGGLTILANTTLYSTTVDINTSNYTINPGNPIELSAIQGTNGDAQNLVVTLIFILA